MARRAFCGVWTIIIDYERNLDHNVFLMYLKISRFLQILPNFALFWQNLRDSKGFRRTNGRRTDGHTHSSNSRLAYTKSPSGNNNYVIPYRKIVVNIISDQFWNESRVMKEEKASK